MNHVAHVACNSLLTRKFSSLVPAHNPVFSPSSSLLCACVRACMMGEGGVISRAAKMTPKFPVTSSKVITFPFKRNVVLSLVCIVPEK